MHQLTLGRLRGLQRIASPAGIFAMTALDHRGSMRRMIRPDTPKAVGGEMLTQYKQEICAALAPASTAMLLDPIYGAAQVLASGALPREVGLLVSLEKTGYTGSSEARLTELLPDWSAEKVKRMGAEAAKLLIYYHPGQPETAAQQRRLVCRVAEECARLDLPLLVEPLAYPVGDGDQDPAEFARRKPGVVAETARQVTALGIDVLKAEFPADLRYEHDEGRLLAACQQLDEAAQAPWVLLSAGVTFEEFARQVEIAAKAGASGFLAGRAVWQEAMAMTDGAERRRWLETVAADRVRRLAEIATSYGRPWWKKWAACPADLVRVDEDWYKTY
ncbi:MAG: tagatose 1,6-diphosphate aldolase [Chloroflexi bacterium]|nr:tagatose 1,6-diphosphate aldolase [Chloroflexota bacterium]